MLYSIDLEKSVLSSLLSIEDIIATTGVELCEQDFYAGRHQVIFGPFWRYTTKTKAMTWLW